MPPGIYDRQKCKTLQFPNYNWSETEKSYLAGIIDGEGCIMVIHHKPSSKSGHRWEYWTLRVSVCNTNKLLIDWILERCGGNFQISVSKIKTYKDTYTWRVDSKRAKPILELILPYLILKKDQALLALEMISTSKLVGCKGHARETIELRRSISIKIKSLNRRGQ